MTDKRVCVDASLVLEVLLPYPASDNGARLWEVWTDSQMEVFAPPLFFAELTSVLRESVHFDRITAEHGEEAFNLSQGLRIRPFDTDALQRRAWDLARQYNRPRAYDAQYLAAASLLGCDLWTADRKMVNAVPVPWLKWVGDYLPDQVEDEPGSLSAPNALK